MSSNPYKRTSVNDAVSTPRCFYNDLDAHFAFDFDPAPRGGTVDGLAPETAWGESNFINPPFSDIEPWLKRAVESGKQCVFVLPLRSNSRYWRRYVYPNLACMYLLSESVQFIGYDRGWATPVVVVVLHARDGRTPDIASIGGIPVVKLVPVSGDDAPGAAEPPLGTKRARV